MQNGVQTGGLFRRDGVDPPARGVTDCGDPLCGTHQSPLCVKGGGTGGAGGIVVPLRTPPPLRHPISLSPTESKPACHTAGGAFFT